MKKKKSEERKWEELPMDYLLVIFERVGIKSLLVDVPYVCKSWYKATRSPFCWRELDFSDISHHLWFYDLFSRRFRYEYGLSKEVCSTKFLKVVVDRSAGCATMVKLPSCYSYTKEALSYVAHKCPALKKLVVHSRESSTMLALSVAIGKFKHLESLEIKCGFLFGNIVTQIGGNCEDFVALSFDAANKAFIGETETMLIVTCLPKIKCLTLRELFIKRENLISILKGCVELVRLDVSDCRGFDEDDEEILKLASHIPTLNFSGSVFDILSDDYNSEFYDSFFGFEYSLLGL